MADNPTKIYNDFVRANLPIGMSYDLNTNRYDINNHSFFKFKNSNWYYKYISKYGYSAASAYYVNGFEPSLVLDFVEDYYRTDGTASTFSDAVTHSRTGNATMVDADGLLKWAPHNSLTYSEDVSVWGTVGTLAAKTVDTITDDVTSSYHAVQRGIGSGVLADGVRRLISAGVKGGSIEFASVGAYHAASGYVYATVNLATGAIANSGVVGTSILHSATVVPLPDGFYFVTLDVTYSGSANPTYCVGLSDDGTVTDRAMKVYAGAGDTLQVKYLQVGRSDLGGMVNNPDTGNSYVPTTTAAVYSPRRGNHVWNGSAWVNEGLLHESAGVTNLLTYSEDITDVSWSKITNTSIGLPVVSGGISLDKFESTGVDSFRNFWKSVASISVGGYLTFSCYIKAGTSPETAIRIDDAGTGASSNRVTVPINWSGGVPTLAAASTLNLTDLGAKIVPMGNSGLYRVSLTVQNNTAGALTLFASYYVTWDGPAAVEDTYVGGLQAERGSVPTSYIPTAGATATRAAETLTVPIANVPYPDVVETTGTELASQVFADWTATASTLTDNGDGTWNLTDTDGGIGYINDQLTGLTVGNVYQVTSTVTNNTTSGNLTLQVGTSGGGSQVASTQVRADTNGTMTFNFVASATAHFLGFRSSAFVAGDGFDFTPISVKEINPLAVSIQMDGLMTGTSRTFADWTLDASNGILMQSGASDFTFTQEAVGVVDTVIGGSYTSGTNVPFSIASRHGSTFINGAVDGTALTANLTPTAFPDLSATNVQIGTTFTGNIGKFRMWGDTDGDIGDIGIAEASA